MRPKDPSFSCVQGFLAGCLIGPHRLLTVDLMRFWWAALLSLTLSLTAVLPPLPNPSAHLFKNREPM